MKLLLVNPSKPRRRFRARRSSTARKIAARKGQRTKAWRKAASGAGYADTPDGRHARRAALARLSRSNPKPKRKLSAAQIAAGFGGKRRQKSSRRLVRAVQKRLARRNKARRTKTSTRRNPSGNKSMAIKRRRRRSRRARLNPRRRRRVLRLNPGTRRRRRRRLRLNPKKGGKKKGKKGGKRASKRKTKRSRRRRLPAALAAYQAKPRRRSRRDKMLDAYRTNPSRRSRRRKSRSRRRRSNPGTALTHLRGKRAVSLRRSLRKYGRKSRSFRTTALAYSHARKAKKLARSPKEQAFLRAAGLAGVPNPGIGALKGLVKLAPTILGGFGGFVGAAALGSLVAVKVAPSLPAALPAFVRNQTPAISAGLLTTAAYLIARNAAPRASLPIAIGGGIATLILVCLGIKVKGKDASGADVEVTLAKRLGLPFGEYTRMGAAGGSVRGIFAGVGEYTHTGGTDDDPEWSDGLRGTDDDPEWDDGAGVLEGAIWD